MEVSLVTDIDKSGEEEQVITHLRLHDSARRLINCIFDTTPAMLRKTTKDVPYYTHEWLQPLKTRITFFEDNKGKSLFAACLVTFATTQLNRINKITNACMHAITCMLDNCDCQETLYTITIATTVAAASARHLQNNLLTIIEELAKLNSMQHRQLLLYLGKNKQPSITEGFADQWEEIKKCHLKGSASQSGGQFPACGRYHPANHG
ncbi:hypothetical protein IW150_005002 [Coemansia sp. RSA 2607]|nr:hypothetical protein IW150_005002 [Coemansia sp. RSA 2607]